MDLTALSSEEVAIWCLNAQIDTLKEKVISLTPPQIAACVAVLDQQHDSKWREKLITIFKSIKECPQLESFGRVITLLQSIEILDHIIHHTHKENWKLSPLLVGMSHPIFTQLLLAASPAHMDALRHEVIAEPIQHHLTVLTHEVARQLPLNIEKIPLLIEAIETLDVKELGHAELGLLLAKINQAAEYYHDTLNKINKTLLLTWSSNRPDLIDKLSSAKEQCQKHFGLVVGKPRTATSSATGLYAFLEKKLASVYGNPDDPQDIEAVLNEEPALEALAKFSIWYIKDYWTLGLLPSLSKAIDFDRSDKKENYFEEVRTNLSKLGLNTVGDLKQAGIFSRKSLEEYIAHNRYLLRT